MHDLLHITIANSCEHALSAVTPKSLHLGHHSCSNTWKQHLCHRANRRRRRGAKPKGLGSAFEIAWPPEYAAPGPRSELLASLTSGSRAHDVGQATTPQGQPWGVCISRYKRSSTRSSERFTDPWYLSNFNNLISPCTDAHVADW